MTDREADPSDRGEPSQYLPTDQDHAIVEEARARYAASLGGGKVSAEVIALPCRDPEGKAGAWLLHGQQGAK